MRRIAIIFSAALLVALPTISHAQYNDADRQNPKEYHDEDSQPLALFADIIYPIGYGLEWLVARPMHWIANDSPVAPVYRPVGGTDTSPPPPVPIIPDNTMDQATTSTSPQDWSPTRAPVTTNSTVIRQTAPPAVTAPQPVTVPQPVAAPPSSGQPVYH
ncbi:MAG TPA: hypothetical protein VNT29_06315 [Candidatus Limnocylindrales bacterium]|nr:hypothetical protein [Candidatus Limnocylindrales bacterium]